MIQVLDLERSTELIALLSATGSKLSDFVARTYNPLPQPPAPDGTVETMNIKILGALAAVALLAACSSTPPATVSTNNQVQGSVAQPPGGPPPGSEADLVANVGDRVFFAFNRSDLTDEAKATLDRQSAWLAKYPSVSLQVAGNCDDRGTEEYNLALGNRRATAAKDYLVAKGVDGSRLTTISYGKDKPTATGDNEQAWAQNRNAISSVQ